MNKSRTTTGFVSNFAVMEYLFKDTGKDNGIAGYPIKDEQDLLLVMACLVLRKLKAEVSIPAAMKLTENVLVQLPFLTMENGKLNLNPDKIVTEDKVVIDVQAFPESVFGLSVMFAASGMEADITGLESFSKGSGQEKITCLQRILYRLNINTDYCGGSKFKVYNNKEMKAGLSLTTKTENFSAALLIPAAIKTGELRLAINEKKLHEKTELLTAAGILFEKRSASLTM